MRADDEEMPPEDIARIVHDAQRDLQEWLKDPYPSQVWDSLPEKERVGTNRVVRLVQQGFPPEYVHQIWVDDLAEKGWSHGTIKDPGHKRHPCMVPWNKLPFWEQQKVYLAFDIVKRMSQGRSN